MLFNTFSTITIQIFTSVERKLHLSKCIKITFIVSVICVCQEGGKSRYKAGQADGTVIHSYPCSGAEKNR